MAYIDDSQKIDLLWKKIQYGVTQTGAEKSPYEELAVSNEQIRASEIWQNDKDIPSPAVEVANTVATVDIRMCAEPSVEDNTAWIAVAVYANGITPENRLRDFISPKFDPSYEIRVYADANKTQRIFNSSIETNWIFDYAAGVLWFPDPTIAPTEVYITGFRYIGPKGLPATFSGDVIDVLTELTDGDFSGGYVKGWVENQTRIADAVDDLNRALLDLVPTSTAMLAGMLLEMPGSTTVINDANVVLSEGFKDSTNGTVNPAVPGEAVEKVVGINLETSYVGPFADGQSGTLSVRLNNADAGSVTLVAGDNSGIYGNLDLNQDISDKSTNLSFFETLVARAVNLNLPTGLNALSLRHSTTGESSTLWLVRDSSNVKPTVTLTTVEPKEDNPVVYSSGIPHYARGSILYVGAKVDNLATDIHLDAKNIEFQTIPQEAGPTVWAFPNENGLPKVLEKGATYTANNVIYSINDYDGNVSHGTVQFRVTARNPNGKADLTSTQMINYMRGGVSVGLGPVEEQNVPVSDLGVADTGMQLYATRVLLPSGNTPQANFMPGMLPVWVARDEVPAHEAAIVGGAIRHTTTDYTGYLPAGPDYSSHDANQYATFAIQRKHVSQFMIEIEGRYTELYVKLLGVSGFSRTSNGWLNAMQNYEGWGIPGRDVNAGCAVGRPASGGSQNVHVTFGPQSSSNATDNIILVRFRLTHGQAITGLRFSGVTNEL